MVDEKEELDVQETRHIIGPNSYDDNFNLIYYTSELRDKNDNFFAFVDFNADDVVGKIRECPHCLEYEIHNKLKPRILKKGQVKSPDYYDFVQCYECGEIVPIYEAKKQSKLTDFVETSSNPFDQAHVITGLGNKKSKSPFQKQRQKLLDRIELEKDEDIKQVLKRGCQVDIIE